MKTKNRSELYWQSILSALVFGIFAYIAIGSFGGEQQKRDLGNGVFEVSKSYSNGKVETYTGTVDKYGRWHGKTTIVQEINFELDKTEVVTMVDGVRNGESKTTWSNGAVEVHCYNMGERVDCDKSGLINTNEKTAFEILDYKYPWFVYKLNAFGFNNEYISSYLDTVLMVMDSYNLEFEDFEDSFGDAVDELEESRFDSLIYINEELSMFQGLELLDGNDFRMAVIDRYLSGTESTFDVIMETYSNYMNELKNMEINNADFEVFSIKFDSLMNSYGALVITDPFLLDSLDSRIYRALDYIISSEKSTALLAMTLKSNFISVEHKNYSALIKIANPFLNRLNLKSAPKDVAGAVVSLMILKFSEGNLIKKAVYESERLKNGIIGLPVVTTEFSTRNTATSVTINGFVTEDGGAAVTSRGVAWAKINNPTISDQIHTVGSGLGSFSSTISGLTENETYFARSFATNSKGTVYGNCVSFTASLNTGIQAPEKPDPDFIVFPNPASDNIIVSFWAKPSEITGLTIVNINGQVVDEQHISHLRLGENQVVVNISNLENGIYYCRLTIDGNPGPARKFIVVH